MLNRLRTVIRDIRVSRSARRTERPFMPVAPLVLRRNRAATVIHVLRSQTNLLLAPRIGLAATFLTPVGSRMSDTVTQLTEHLIRKEEIVERVLRRAMRIEAGEASPPLRGEEMARAVLPHARSATQVLLKAASPASAVAVTSQPADTSTRAPKFHRAAPQHDITSIDINRLTDQVAMAIDRRISAHRERLGRR